MNGQNTLILVLGPTAVGKTAYAIALAKHFQTEIISADSRQFYSELKVGVARPTDAELKEVPHHFIGFLPVTDYYSAGDYSRDAEKKLHALFQLHDIVIAVGGSMMYLDALVHGFDDLPGDRERKAEIQKAFQENGISFLQNRLKELDPEYYAQVDILNPHRLMRAIEVCEVSGQKYSALRKNEGKTNAFHTIKIGLTAQRNKLYKRINNRVEVMFQDGLIAEAQSMLPHRQLNALNTVGYKEMFEYLDGHVSLDFAKDKIKQHTRNFAKRQLTWWRRDDTIHWLDITADEPSIGFAEFLISNQ
ncbi:MAG: tRNA (adenosine(37)-N6)-dimethylallyltransferase MiaA [Flavobacteriales bacterium]